MVFVKVQFLDRQIKFLRRTYMSLKFKIVNGITVDQYGREFRVTSVPESKKHKRKYHDKYKESHGVKPYVKLKSEIK
jgi:hypothetical protein